MSDKTSSRLSSSGPPQRPTSGVPTDKAAPSSRSDNYYTATLDDSVYWPPLEGELEADVAIVGGGFTGVATAVELSERGYSVVLLEGKRIGWGATGRNGGQVTGSLSGDEAMLRQLRQREGVDAAQFVSGLRWRGHDIISDRVARYDIDCDLKRGHLHTAWSDRHVNALKASMASAEQAGLGDTVRWLDRGEVQERLETSLYQGGVLNTRNLHLHSLKLCVGEAQAAASLGARLFEDSEVIRIEHGKNPVLVTSGGRVTASTVLLAGNAYHRLAQHQFAGLLFPAILGNLVTEPLDEMTAAAINRDDLAVYDSRVVLDYYRLTADRRLMFGGGTNYSGREIDKVDAELRPALENTFPRLRGIGIDFAWTGTAGIVLNRIPMVGRLALTPNVYFAQGYSGHGIATTHVVAEILADAMSGEVERFDTFQAFKHIRLPVGQQAGNALLALGMAWYRLKERLAGG